MPGLWVVASLLGYVNVAFLVGESISQFTDGIAQALIPAIWMGLALALLWKRRKEPPPRTDPGEQATEGFMDEIDELICSWR